MSEDDLHTQRVARKSIDVRRASLGFFMSRRREGNGGPVEKKRVRRSPISFALKFPRTMVPAYIVSREKKEAQAFCACTKNFAAC